VVERSAILPSSDAYGNNFKIFHLNEKRHDIIECMQFKAGFKTELLSVLTRSRCPCWLGWHLYKL